MNYTEIGKLIKDLLMESAKLSAWRFVLIWLLFVLFLLLWQADKVVLLWQTLFQAA